MRSGAPKTENVLIEAISKTAKIDDDGHVNLVMYRAFNEFKHLADRAKSLSGLTPLQFAAQCGNRWAVWWLQRVPYGRKK